MNYDHRLKLVNCAGCKAELLGESMLLVPQFVRELWCDKVLGYVPGMVRGRVKSRPYCGGCLPKKGSQ